MSVFVGRKIRTSESLELFQTFPLSLVLDSLGGGTLPSTLWCPGEPLLWYCAMIKSLAFTNGMKMISADLFLYPVVMMGL